MSPAATSVRAGAGASSESAVATAPRGSSRDALRRQEQLRDLDRVQRCALAQVVAGEEEREAVFD